MSGVVICLACGEPLDACLLCGGEHCTDLACEDMPRECRDQEMRWVRADEAYDAAREDGVW